MSKALLGKAILVVIGAIVTLSLPRLWHTLTGVLATLLALHSEPPAN